MTWIGAIQPLILVGLAGIALGALAGVVFLIAAFIRGLCKGTLWR